MPADKGLDALRTSAAIGDGNHVACVRVAGASAFDAINRICPRELFVRDGQILHTLLLREDGRPLADVYVCADDREFLLLAEGISGDALVEHVRACAPAGADVAVTNVSKTHALLSLDGPYAWEVFAELAGPEVIGQPYMTFFRDDARTTFRVGKTGEYGYYFLVPGETADGLRAALHDRGSAFDLATADLEALDQCALENWFFNIRREGREDITPIELQLQWRMSYRKDFVGSAALAARRGHTTHRIVQCAGATELAAGDPVAYGERTIGRVINAGFSQCRGDWVGVALLENAYSHAGIAAYAAQHGTTAVPIRTLTAPAINNRSLFVNPQLHSYLTRAEVQFPPLVAPGSSCASPTGR